MKLRHVAAAWLLTAVLTGAAAAEETILSRVEAFLKSDSWRYEPVEGTSALRMRYEGQNGTWTVLVYTRESLRQAGFYSVLPDPVPDDRLPAVAEYLHRANYDLAIGCFELDWDTGQVRFRTSLDLEGGELGDRQIRNYLYANVLTCDRYLKGLADVSAGRATPAEAIAAVEAPDAVESPGEGDAGEEGGPDPS
jgi:hypothetical protein